jgi:hypothetical protein
MRAHVLAICLVFVSLSAAAEARAETAPGAETATSTELPLKLELGSSKLDAESVRKAIELELKRPVVLTSAPGDAASLSLVVHRNHTVTVSYRSSTGSTRSRSIVIPEDGARGAEVIALLAGNLSRDEAAELLADLAAKPAQPAPAAVAATSDGPEPVAEERAAEPAPARVPSAAEMRPPPSAKRTRAKDPPPLLETPFPAINLSLVAPLAVYRSSERRVFAGELGLAYSRVGALHGAGLNVLVLRTEQDVRGASFATLYNGTGGKVTGVTGSALVNRTGGLRGFEFSGLLNLGSGDARAFAVAGLANLERDFRGVQLAGLANRSNRFQGVQVAGALNRAGAFTGVQAAGAVNIAGSLSGLQLGVVNVAGDVRGLQLGVVNVAKKVKGTSVGLVSVAENGRVQPVLWASSSLPLNAAAKFTVGPIYTQAGLGYARSNQTYTYELGLGGHFPIGRFFIEPGVHYSEMRSAKHPFDHGLIEYAHYRIAAGLDRGRISPFAGIGILQRFAHSADAPSSVPVTVEVFGGAALF